MLGTAGVNAKCAESTPNKVSITSQCILVMSECHGCCERVHICSRIAYVPNIGRYGRHPGMESRVL